jgi:hypothetical protein
MAATFQFLPIVEGPGQCYISKPGTRRVKSEDPKTEKKKVQHSLAQQRYRQKKKKLLLESKGPSQPDASGLTLSFVLPANMGIVPVPKAESRRQGAAKKREEDCVYWTQERFDRGLYTNFLTLMESTELQCLFAPHPTEPDTYLMWEWVRSSAEPPL